MLSGSQVGQCIPSGGPKTSPKRFKQRMKNENWRISIHNSRNHWKQGKALVGGSSTGPLQLAESAIRYDMNKSSD